MIATLFRHDLADRGQSVDRTKRVAATPAAEEEVAIVPGQNAGMEMVLEEDERAARTAKLVSDRTAANAASVWTWSSLEVQDGRSRPV